jgi:hypothetical protein
MAATRKLTVEVLGDAKGATSAFKEISDGTNTLGDQFIDFGKKVGLGFAAVTAGTALFIKDALGAAYDSQKVSAQTGAIIKATGRAAGLTEEQVQGLAESLSFKTGVDDEAIQTSMNMLLTFKRVRNEMGEGNNVFDRAAGAMLDLGNVFGSSDAAAMQLGKALSDPVQGITSLRRAGINFTESQRDQIKALVESGDVLGAQKLILAEVESQVGGTAAATSTSADRMKVGFENLQERIGNLVLPALERFARVIVEKVLPAIENIVDKYGPPIVDFFQRLWDTVSNVASTIADALYPIVKRIGDWMAENKEVVTTFFSVLAGAAVIAMIATLASTIGALFNPITLIIGTIALLVAAFVYAYDHFEGFRAIVDAVARFITETIIPGLAAAFGWLKDRVAEFVDGVRSRWEDIKTATSNVFAVVKTIIELALGAIKLLWDTFGETIVGAVRRTWEAVAGVLRGAFEILKGIFDVFLGILSGNWGRVWDGLKGIVSGALNAVKGVAGALLNPIITAFQLIWDGVKATAEAPFDALIWLVRGAINTVISVINRFIGIWNAIQFTAPKVHIPGTDWDIGGFTIGLPDIRPITRLAEGGIVMSPTIASLAEREPEAVIPLSRLAPSGTTQVTINVSGADPNAVVEALKRYYRQNGAIPIRTVNP